MELHLENSDANINQLVDGFATYVKLDNTRYHNLSFMQDQAKFKEHGQDKMSYKIVQSSSKARK